MPDLVSIENRLILMTRCSTGLHVYSGRIASFAFILYCVAERQRVATHHGGEISQAAVPVAVLDAHNLEAVWNHHTLPLLEFCRDALTDLDPLECFCATLGLLWYHPAAHSTLRTQQISQHLFVLDQHAEKLAKQQNQVTAARAAQLAILSEHTREWS